MWDPAWWCHHFHLWDIQLEDTHKGVYMSCLVEGKRISCKLDETKSVYKQTHRRPTTSSPQAPTCHRRTSIAQEVQVVWTKLLRSERPWSRVCACCLWQFKNVFCSSQQLPTPSMGAWSTLCSDLFKKQTSLVKTTVTLEEGGQISRKFVACWIIIQFVPCALLLIHT